MKKIGLLFLLSCFIFPFFTSAQQVNSISPSNRIPLTNNKASKMDKEINSAIGIYLKNGDVATKNGNYGLAIQNYELAINKLKTMRGTQDYIRKIELIIKSLQSKAKIQPTWKKIDNDYKKIDTTDLKLKKSSSYNKTLSVRKFR